MDPSLDELESFAEINNIKISYARVGNGPQNLLCLPGAIGSWRTDYRPQLQGGLDPEKFTIIAMDPPGLGNSRPPDRINTKQDLLEKTELYNMKDAEIAHLLMEDLGLLPYSILGWGDGGVTAMIIAYEHRDSDDVQKLVLWGSHAYLTEDEAEFYDSCRDINSLSSEMKGPMVKLYGRKYFQTIWARYTDIRKEMQGEWNGNIIKEMVPQINKHCLILHGTKDWLCPTEHPHYLKDTLPNSHLIIKDGGQHNLHIRDQDWFQTEVEFFLAKNEKLVQGTEKINWSDITYAKIGHGPNYLLCCVDALGSWTFQFRKVLEEFDHDKFTIVAWDPPGYGKTKKKKEDKRFYMQNKTPKDDAVRAHKLMKKLRLVPFSVLGFGEGGVTALRMAIEAPRTVRKLVLWGTRTHVTAQDYELFKAFKEVVRLDAENIKPYIDMYGQEYFEKTWKDYCLYMIDFYKIVYQGDIVRSILPNIKQKTLVLHGQNDNALEYHAKYIAENVKDARLEVCADAGHDLVKDNFPWFKEQFEKFFFENERIPESAEKADEERSYVKSTD